jgi:Superinfection immunity protein
MMLDLLSVVVVLVAGAIYLLPLIIGLARGVRDIGSVAVINILLGWTLVGWAAALALAMRSVSPDNRDTQQLPPVPPLAWPPDSWPGWQPGPPPLPLPPPTYGPDDPTDLG